MRKLKNEPRHFLLYWQPRWMDYAIEKNQPLKRIGSYHFQRLRKDDTVWVASIVGGRFYLVAHIEAAEVLPRRAAIERTGEELGGRFYAFARNGTAEKARRLDVTRFAPRLRFESQNSCLDAGNPRLWPMQLQTMRQLTPESAKLLETEWKRGKKNA